ncbi:hypothetical protein tb265_27160 [Gemmatimonadetes bacterium T265]|nr:hypothetical protein tb265_27160 [Gemmatimonadetes bacterium T265]
MVPKPDGLEEFFMTHASLTSRSAARARAAFTMTALTLAAACGGQPKSDDGLKSDLSLTTRPAAGQQVVSPQELTPGVTTPAGTVPGTVGPNGAPVTAVAPAAPAPKTDTIVHTVYRDRPARHHRTGSSSGGTSGTYSNGTASSAPTVAQQPTVRQGHTKEGAIIGGAAGAVLGAATGGVKGGVIGGVLGGAAGAVIGNNTGVKHVPQP